MLVRLPNLTKPHLKKKVWRLRPLKLIVYRLTPVVVREHQLSRLLCLAGNLLALEFHLAEHCDECFKKSRTLASVSQP